MITLLDYSAGTVWQLRLPEGLETSEEIEEWLEENGFKSKEIYFMAHGDENIYTNEDL